MKKDNTSKENIIDKNNKKKDIKMIIFYTNITLFIILTILVFTRLIDPLDELVSSFIIDIRNNNLTKVMLNITNIGGAYSLVAISLLLLVIIKNKKIPLSIILNLICVFLGSQIFKIIFRRPRPEGVFLTPAGGFSYPSGHSIVSIAYITYITYLIYKHTNNKLLKIISIICSVIITILIGFSRIYLGVHYTSDVLGGFILGIAYLTLYIKYINKKGLKI